MDDDHLYQAPRNGLQPSAMHRKDGDSHRYLVIAQLDWGPPRRPCSRRGHLDVTGPRPDRMDLTHRRQADHVANPAGTSGAGSRSGRELGLLAPTEDRVGLRVALRVHAR